MSGLFILAGNGPYDNRGCEAIVRGTVRIVRSVFDAPKFLVCSQFDSDEHLLRQRENETDPDIRHVRMHLLPRVGRPAALNSLLWKLYGALGAFRRRHLYRDLSRDMGEARAVLSVGGDNYGLDYGTLRNYTDLDDLVLDRGKKLVIWGASMGPFSRQKDVETFMSAHLRLVTAILVRSSASLAYLKSLGVGDNVFQTADPSFAMEPSRPDGLDIPELDAQAPRLIGMNFSPLMAKYVCGGDLENWRLLCVDVLRAVIREFPDPVLLVPHVTDPSGREDDHRFMKSVLEALPSGRVRLLTPGLDAAETKWVISRCRVFAGARTHATLAAFSTHVPTLCFAYSIKAKAISRDIYGHEDYCLEPEEFNGKNVVLGLKDLLREEDRVRTLLRQRVPVMVKRAYESGHILKKICSE